MNFKQIKKMLLNNENIENVKIDAYKGQIVIFPVQNEEFYYIAEPLKKYLNDDNKIVLGDKVFKIVNYKNFNTIIYKITLKCI